HPRRRARHARRRAPPRGPGRHGGPGDLRLRRRRGDQRPLQPTRRPEPGVRDLPSLESTEGDMRSTTHPLNASFRWTDARAPFRRLTPEQARRWNEDGFFVLDDVLDPAQVRALVDEIDPWDEQTEAMLRARPDGRWFIARAGEITFSIHLVTRSALLRAF